MEISVFGKILSEFFGTMILILLGDGVVANVVLNKTKGQNSGWIVITTGWAFAVGIPVYITGWIGGAHFNPAVTIGMAVIGKFPWAQVPGYIVAQFLGAFVGAILVYITYRDHFAVTDDKDAKLGVFCTIPAIRNLFNNFITEVIGTAVLLIGILGISNEHNQVGAIGAFLVGILIWVIGLTLGGPTGYAINPARDIGPRFAHAVLPIPDKRDSDWGYGLIVPLFGPIVGGILGAVIYQAFINMI
ncbi:MIP/aquaporin family protein [Thermoanaerobacterium sp. RBIITD]|uniref:MIP/aquaporin family protein n=1 Tax=Thermoanaerobacterium sp. RBIITD TaxID=1550240 RepID=UPI000BB8C002|nr:MIP/aquaporin family protein [Thermoanaerobacterium sp. RBIITD]SNX54560.1 glycerol uptake facilitator protein [Thermoanaerobacterium sp. RBIITD]